MSVVANGMTESAFVGKGLACVRGDRLVFRKLDVCLSPGDAVLLLGRNGSGKSSLLRALAGLVPLAAGELSWHDGGQAQGVSLADDREGHAARTRYLGHADAIKPVLTVAENVSFWARLWQPSSEADVADRVAKALAAFNMTALADVPGRFLSAGQKRRTNLARLEENKRTSK